MRDRSSGGGSTLSQQLAKNIIGRKGNQPLSILISKTKEAILAYRLEKVYDKKEILRLYFNTVPFGENIYGIKSAALRFFNKDVIDLNLQESAVLVGLLKANTYYNPRLHPQNALQRRNVVFHQMKKYNYLNANETDSLCQLPLGLDYLNLASQGPANYFIKQVKIEAENIFKDLKKPDGSNYDLKKDGLTIKTTLNLKMQKSALNAFQKHLSTMQSRLRNQYKSGSSKNELTNLVNNELKRLKLVDKANLKSQQMLFDWKGSYADSISVRDSIEHALTLLHAGLLALDPQSGAIKIYVGGIDFNSQEYDQITAKRQLASTFKPILYTAALEQGISPCEYLSNMPIRFPKYQYWTPSNYDDSIGGLFSFKGALKKSMNIPTVHLYTHLEDKRLNDTWNKLGFQEQLSDFPSTALGTGEGSIYELAAAYSAFANGGSVVSPWCISEILDADGDVIYKNNSAIKKEKVISEESASIMAAILQDAITDGTGIAIRSKYGVNIPLAGKTGTSQDYTDAWFAAFNPNIVIVSRVGASTPAVHFNNGSNGSGSRLALPLVGYTLNEIEKNSTLKNKINGSFPPLSPFIEMLLECDDFKEKLSRKEEKSSQLIPEKSTQKNTKKKKEKKRRKKKNRR